MSRKIRKNLDISTIMNHLEDFEQSFTIIDSSTNEVLAEQNDKVRDYDGKWIEYNCCKVIGWRLVDDILEIYI